LLSVLDAEEADNLAEEYAILNLSLFLTKAGDSIVTDKYVFSSFRAADGSSTQNCQVITLPPEVSEGGAKDIYVIANCDNATALNSIETVGDLRALTTTKLHGVNNMLTTERGLPMYGEYLNAELNNTDTTPINIRLLRLCAKLDITLTFTNDTWIGTNNRFGIDHAASYTYFVRNDAFVIDSLDLVYYPLIAMEQQAANVFHHIAYVYESKVLPFMHLYTVINGKLYEYVAKDNFPLPVRNRMYAVEIEILEPLSAETRTSGDFSPQIRQTVSESVW
jgi:hypothetical protein